MSIVAVIPNVQTSLPLISLGGELATISLLVSVITALLISDSKNWNKWASGTLNICIIPLLLTFVAIIAFKIKQIL